MIAFPLPVQGFRPFESLVAAGDLPETRPKGRRCALGLCGCDAPAFLSIYNLGDTCAVCTPKIARIVREAIGRTDDT